MPNAFQRGLGFAKRLQQLAEHSPHAFRDLGNDPLAAKRPSCIVSKQHEYQQVLELRMTFHASVCAPFVILEIRESLVLRQFLRQVPAEYYTLDKLQPQQSSALNIRVSRSSQQAYIV